MKHWGEEVHEEIEKAELMAEAAVWVFAAGHSLGDLAEENGIDLNADEYEIVRKLSDRVPQLVANAWLQELQNIKDEEVEARRGKVRKPKG